MKKLFPLQIKCDNCKYIFDITEDLNLKEECPNCSGGLSIYYSILIEVIK